MGWEFQINYPLILIFRKLVQKQASTASKLDIKMCSRSAPLNRNCWPDYFNHRSFANSRRKGFKLLMQRAILVRTFRLSLFLMFILHRMKSTRTPSNEPLRFVASVKPKKKEKFKEVTLETKTLKNQ